MPQERVVQPLPPSPRHQTPDSQRIPAQQAVERLALLVEELHVARGAEQTAHLHVRERPLAEAAQLVGRELDVVVGVDDLVGEPQREAVGSDEHRRAVRVQDAGGLRDRSLGVGHVLERLHRDDRGELVVAERQVAHVGDDRGAILAGERGGIDVHSDGLAGRQQVVAVTDATAQVEHVPGSQPGLARGVGGHVALPGRVEPAFGSDDPLAGDLHPRRLLARSDGGCSQAASGA